MKAPISPADSFKYAHSEKGITPIPVLDYLSLYFNTQERQVLEEPCYRVGTILHTANSRKSGNAIITGIQNQTYRVLSDLGLEIWLTLPQIEVLYLKPINTYPALTPNIPAYHKSTKLSTYANS